MGALRLVRFCIDPGKPNISERRSHWHAVRTRMGKSTTPAPINAFELETGRRFDLLPNGKDESMHCLSCKGALVRAEGTPRQYPSGLDLAAAGCTCCTCCRRQRGGSSRRPP